MKNQQATIIRKASDCNIRRFMACLFDNNLSALVLKGKPKDGELVQAWANLYTEYVDLSNTSVTEEVQLLITISYLSTQIQVMDMCLSIQKECVQTITLPYFPGFPLLRRYGHKLYWDTASPDLAGFLQQLETIKAKEAAKQAQLDFAIKKLTDLKAKKAKDTARNKNSRKDFISTFNRLNMHGFALDMDKTTIEQLAVAIGDYTEQCEKSAASNQKQAGHPGAFVGRKQLSKNF